jgi:hypothetical protein
LSWRDRQLSRYGMSCLVRIACIVILHYISDGCLITIAVVDIARCSGASGRPRLTYGMLRQRIHTTHIWNVWSGCYS